MTILSFFEVSLALFSLVSVTKEVKNINLYIISHLVYMSGIYETCKYRYMSPYITIKRRPRNILKKCLFTISKPLINFWQQLFSLPDGSTVLSSKTFDRVHFGVLTGKLSALWFSANLILYVQSLLLGCYIGGTTGILFYSYSSPKILHNFCEYLKKNLTFQLLVCSLI